MEIFEILVILGIRIVKYSIKWTNFINNILPSTFNNRHIWLVVPSSFTQTFQDIRASFNNCVMTGVICLNLFLRTRQAVISYLNSTVYDSHAVPNIQYGAFVMTDQSSVLFH